MLDRMIGAVGWTGRIESSEFGLLQTPHRRSVCAAHQTKILNNWILGN